MSTIPGLVSAHNGVRIDMPKGPNELAYYKGAHENTLFEGNSFRGRVGAQFKDGQRQPDEADGQASTEISVARARMEAREREKQVAAGSDDGIDQAAIDAAEGKNIEAPKLTEEESAAALNNRLFNTPIPEHLAANIRKFKAGVEVTETKKSTRSKK